MKKDNLMKRDDLMREIESLKNSYDKEMRIYEKIENLISTDKDIEYEFSPIIEEKISDLNELLRKRFYSFIINYLKSKFDLKNDSKIDYQINLKLDQYIEYFDYRDFSEFYDNRNSIINFIEFYLAEFIR